MLKGRSNLPNKVLIPTNAANLYFQQSDFLGQFTLLFFALLLDFFVEDIPRWGLLWPIDYPLQLMSYALTSQ